MNAKPKIKQIQLLGSTFVSGYFAFAELLNYKQFNQRKIIKPFELGGVISYYTEGNPMYNVIKRDDTLGKIGFNSANLNNSLNLSGITNVDGPSIIRVPFDYVELLRFDNNKVRVYESTNKSYSHYLVFPYREKYTIYNNVSVVVGLAAMVGSQFNYSVAYIDMVINTTEPITLNYVGEAEFIQNSNIDNNFTPLFKINRYDYNCY